jgi:hypothetical protein
VSLEKGQEMPDGVTKGTHNFWKVLAKTPITTKNRSLVTAIKETPYAGDHDDHDNVFIGDCHGCNGVW